MYCQDVGMVVYLHDLEREFVGLPSRHLFSTIPCGLSPLLEDRLYVQTIANFLQKREYDAGCSLILFCNRSLLRGSAYICLPIGVEITCIWWQQAAANL